jgi:hypothetical protein
MRLAVVLGGCVVAIALLAGCGSSGSTSTSTPSAGEGEAEKAAFIATADSRCEASRKQAEPVQRQVQEAGQLAREEEEGGVGIAGETRATLIEGLGKLVAISEAGLEELKELKSPVEDASQLEAIFQNVERAFADTRAYGEALGSAEDAKAQAIAERGNAETRKAEALSESYGFKVCNAAPEAG